MKLRLTKLVLDRSSALAGPGAEDGGDGTSADFEPGVCGAGLVSLLGSAAFAFGIIDHLSLKLCAAAGFTFNPIHTKTIAPAIFEATHMIASHTRNNVRQTTGCFGVPLHYVQEAEPHRSKTSPSQWLPGLLAALPASPRRAVMASHEHQVAADNLRRANIRAQEARKAAQEAARP